MFDSVLILLKLTQIIIYLIRFCLFWRISRFNYDHVIWFIYFPSAKVLLTHHELDSYLH